MANMSYCRFQNTLRDLQDCKDAMFYAQEERELSTEEEKAKKKLIQLCVDIANLEMIMMRIK